jgi:uncharacterized cofD-like protein
MLKGSRYRQKILTFGGGTGQFHLLSGLRELNDTRLITAVAGTWDSGGSSGRLRTELGVLPPGDLRRCILALMESEEQRQIAQRLFDDRLEEASGPLKGHSLGNLITARLEHIFKGQDRATDAARTLFKIRAKILPASLTDLQLIAETKKGVIIEGETNIDNRRVRKDFDPKDKISRIFFNTRVDPNPAVLKTIHKAEKIVFAPGDLYTSILPHLLVEGIQEAILVSKAKLFFVLNLTTKRGETDFYKASDYLKAFLFYLGDVNRLDYLIANKNDIEEEVLETYKKVGQELVELDEKVCKKLVPKAKIVKASLARYMRKEHLLRHNPEKLASIILKS